MFMEFDEYVWEHKLVASLESLGACQVNPITFAHNDGGDSAANALLRILSAQTTTGIKYSRGPCPPALLAKVQAKQQAAALAEASASREFDEKTMAAIKQSLEQQQEVMVKVEGGLQSQAAELNGIKNDVQSQAVKLEGIENGVCNVIPDYQNEIRTLKEALAHKTKLCDRIEGQKGRLTMEINKLRWELGERNEENVVLAREKIMTSKKIQDLQMQLDMCQSIALLKQMQEETQRVTELLSATLEEERAAKRQRS